MARGARAVEEVAQGDHAVAVDGVGLERDGLAGGSLRPAAAATTVAVDFS